MVEVFKTNVQLKEDASMLLATIKMAFGCYEANFDLEDCDHILRVACPDTEVDAPLLIQLLADLGFEAKILDDTVL